MKVLNEQQTKKILEANVEDLCLEFKPSFDYDEGDWIRENVIRGMLAMSNTRNGGDIVIGIKQNSDNTFTLDGVSSEHLSKWKQKLDIFKSEIESFATSPVNYEIYEGELSNTKFIIIRITEFNTLPIICRKNGKNKKGNGLVLEEGAIYVRTLKDKPSSIKLTNPIDINDLIERASDKTIEHLHRRGWKHISEDSKNDYFDRFRKEREDF